MVGALSKERTNANKKSKVITDIKQKGKIYDKGFDLEQMRFGGKLNV